MTYFIYALAALFEIAGCFAFWAWLRLAKPVWWLAPGMVSLALFAWLLTLVPSEAAGRTFAAYGGIYIVASLLWLWLAENRVPDRWDIGGAMVSPARRSSSLHRAVRTIPQKMCSTSHSESLEGKPS